MKLFELLSPDVTPTTYGPSDQKPNTGLPDCPGQLSNVSLRSARPPGATQKTS